MKRLIFAAAIVAVFAFPAYAEDAPPKYGCHPRQEIIDALEGYYGETKQSQGLIDNRFLIEIFRSDQTGTWTILKSEISGESCFKSFGRFWVYDPERAPGT